MFDHKIMHNPLVTKNEAWLESKWWYRFLKIIYVGGYILAGLIVLILAYQNLPQVSYDDVITGSWGSVVSTLIFGALIVFALFEISKRIFFYILIRRSILHGLHINWKKAIPILGFMVVVCVFILFFYVQHHNQEILRKNKEDEVAHTQLLEGLQKDEAAVKQELQNQTQKQLDVDIAAQNIKQEQILAQQKLDMAAQQLQKQQQLENTTRVLKCISDAKIKYDSALKQSCSTLSQESERNYVLCAGNVSTLDKQCRGYYPAIPTDCDITQIANGIGEPLVKLWADTLVSNAKDAYQNDKAICYKS